MSDPSEYSLQRLGTHGGENKCIPLVIGCTSIGRLPTNSICTNSKYASRRHCTIDVSETQQITVKNESATNGIFINHTQNVTKDTAIVLTVDDVIGIGCDTSATEILDSECFVFKLTKNNTEADEIIVLDDSDDEEDKIQSEYSQMNISEFKQEYMEMEEYVEEYDRKQSVKVEPPDAGDEIDNIIARTDISFAEKSKMINDIQPNISAILMKDPSENSVDERGSNERTKEEEMEKPSIEEEKKEWKRQTRNESTKKGKEMKKDTKESDEKEQKKHSAKRHKNETKRHTEKESKRDSKTETKRHKETEKETMNKDKESKKITKSEKEKDSTENRKKNSRTSKNRTSSCQASGSKSAESTKILENSTKLASSPFIPLKNLTPEDICNLSGAKESRNDSDKVREATPSRISTRRNTFVPSCISPPQNDFSSTCNKSMEANQSRILKRRNTFVPSSSLASGPTKRPLEIITAPHMPKRRKSVSTVPEPSNTSTKTKNADVKWLSKDVQHKRRSKEEIKMKLAALAPDPKDKVIETKTIRTNTKIPVKNTHRTRNDYLAETIVKTTPPANRKHKISESSLQLPECSKRLRPSDNEIAKEVPSEVQPRRTSFAQNEVNKTDTEPSNKVPDSNHNDNNHIQPNADPNASSSSITSPTVKSILKRANSIQKRRVTVTFAEDCRIKTISPVPAVTTPVVRSEEANTDDVIFNIMSLGISALKESSSATVNGKNFSYKTVAEDYDSLRHLQSVFIPLMKAELWKEIEDGYAQLKNTRITATNVQINSCMPDENYPNRFTYRCETQSSAAIQNGALIMLLDVNSGKEFLGYIISRQMSNKICYFQFVTPCSVQGSGSARAILKLKQIMYIRPNLKVFEALFKLKNSPLINHILHPKQNCLKPQKIAFKYSGYNSLNQDQMITLTTVYRKCVAGHPFIALIEGPPGTGKSRVITNLVMQLLYGKEISQPLKILVCAPSNAAVDILTKNLMEARRNYSIVEGQKKMKLVRFGVLEKMSMSVRGVSIQELISTNEKTLLIEQNKLMERKMKKHAELVTYTAKNDQAKISAIRSEIEGIETSMRNVAYDEKCLLDGANVICTTLNSCCALSSKISSMDVCIIDEATQCNEPTSLIPLQFGVKSLILVGDTKQLPSTVLSDIAKQYNYDQSLFQRLQKSFESLNDLENPVQQLTTQYRMHPEILHWPNEYFYKNRLVSAKNTECDSLKLKPYTVFNLSYVQTTHSGQKHISNVDEAKFVRNLLDFLLTKADPKVYSYGIISAYSQQKNDLAKDLSLSYPYVSVNTIDSCQGQERDIVIISIARTRGIGFLAIRQRLNVALTRAKKVLILCGNFTSLQNHPMWTSFLDDARNRKRYIHFPTMDDSSLSSYFAKTLAT